VSSASGSSWIGTNNIPVEGNIKEVLNYTIIEDGFYRMTVHCNWTSSGYYVYSYIYMGTYHHTYLSEKGSGAGGGNLIFQTPIYYLFKNNIA
jgi:hypothetical protein